ncbi:amidase domain-containing protein [Paenibacillus favisporus]|nr:MULTISPECIES: amidase domain-containing protein [Paenibacillus]MCM3000630.1 amidase domain-containing protein [Paenibacillus cellulositrophicus]MEC0179317.1 amidase domain-containing protein [Paenibacillus favisporus]RED30688.1 putative amidase-like protein [Paenibacillus sp. VMFN-D1]
MGMEKEWKQTLYAYVNQYNQHQIDYRSQHTDQVVTDPAYLLARSERASRLSQWYAARGARPLRSETRAKLLRTIRDTPEEAVIDVQLYVQLFYEKGGVNHVEEMIQRERLTLIRDGDAWVIVSVEQLTPEKHPAAGIPAVHTGQPAYAYSSGGSKPYLNAEVLQGGPGRKTSRYNRAAAAAYADEWWETSNPEFAVFEVDCTNYISQCLFAGGAPIHYTGKRESGWWYKGYVGSKEWWSYSWAVSNALQSFLSSSSWGLRGELVERPEQLMLGDVIFYDWDGDGSFQHSTIVTAFDAGGSPLVNAHTVSSKHRFWDYKDSYAWSENTVYRFLHIPDYF